MKKKIFIRELLLLGLLIVVTCVAMASFEILLNRHQRRQHCREKTQFLAQQLDKLVLWDDRVAVRELLHHALAADPLIRYAFVERNGVPYVHTFLNGVPTGLINLYQATNVVPVLERLMTDAEGRGFCDIAVRIGQNHDFVHLGLDCRRVSQATGWSVFWIAAIGGAFFLLIIYPAHRVAGTITREIEEMTSQLRDANEQLEVRVAERTGELRQANEALVVEVDKRRQAQEQVQQLNAELEQRVIDRTAELAGVVKELERSNKEFEQFAYVASHDLQEPLRKVASFTQLLAERYADKLEDDARQFIAYAVDGAHRMQVLINDLLAYCRVGTRGKPHVPVDCGVVLGYVLANLEMAIKESRAVVTHDGLPTVVGDGVQLTQLFQNLIGNGIKFRGAEPPRIHVSAVREGQEWIFRVRDNGIGIDPQYFDRLFVIFQRLHSRAEYPGTGIGLAISKKVVERHGGRIWVESRPGKGSTFCFSIPE